MLCAVQQAVVHNTPKPKQPFVPETASVKEGLKADETDNSKMRHYRARASIATRSTKKFGAICRDAPYPSA